MVALMLTGSVSLDMHPMYAAGSHTAHTAHLYMVLCTKVVAVTRLYLAYVCGSYFLLGFFFSCVPRTRESFDNICGFGMALPDSYS